LLSLALSNVSNFDILSTAIASSQAARADFFYHPFSRHWIGGFALLLHGYDDILAKEKEKKKHLYHGSSMGAMAQDHTRTHTHTHTHTYT
jgi:hypothetical protein